MTTISDPGQQNSTPLASGRERRRLRRSSALGRLAALFALMLGLLCFLVSFSIGSFGKLIEADRWNVHTYRVLIESGQVLESMVAMDTGVRSFLTLGDEAQLRPYILGQKSFEEHFRRARSLTSDRAEQQARLRTLHLQFEAWQAQLASAIRERRSIRDNERALSITIRSAGAHATALNEMRLSLEGIENYEKGLLQVRSAQQEKFQLQTGRTLLLGGVFSIVLAGGLCTLVLSNTHALSRSNSRLEATNAELARAIGELDAQKQQIEAANREMMARRDELARLNASLKHTNEELGRSNQELEQFAYVASHDLQEPLRAVAGCVQVLQKRYQGQLDARADQFIHHAVDGAARMQNLINDLLLFSRLGTRGKPFAPTDLDAVLKRVLSNLQGSIRESNARISSESLPTLACDEGQIEQVLQNFVANALKFRRFDEGSGLGSGKEKKMLPPVVHIAAKHDVEQKKWIISVSDEGLGIESKYFERIWVMFQRLHTRTEYAGTGIGLAVCKKIIERHGGQVGVESRTQSNSSDMNSGSTFCFSLPEHPVRVQAASASLEEAPEEAGSPDGSGSGHNGSGEDLIPEPSSRETVGAAGETT